MNHVLLSCVFVFLSIATAYSQNATLSPREEYLRIKESRAELQEIMKKFPDNTARYKELLEDLDAREKKLLANKDVRMSLLSDQDIFLQIEKLLEKEISSVLSNSEESELKTLQLEKMRRERKMSSTATTAQLPLRLNGHFQLRTEGARNQRGLPGVRQSEETFYRLRTYFHYEPQGPLTFHFTPQFAKGFGKNDSATVTTSGSTTHTNATFFESYFTFKMTDSLKASLGRQEISYGDHLVIGALPWDNNGRSFDALKFKWQKETFWMDFLYSKISDNFTTPKVSKDDKDLFVLYPHFTFGPYFKDFEPYLVHQRDQTTSATKVNDVTLSMMGLRTISEISNLFIRTETGYQQGANLGDDAYQVNAEIGHRFFNKKLSLSMEFAQAGSDYNQLYPTAHKFLGYSDVLGRRNIKSWVAHLKAQVTDKVSLWLDYHQFSRLRTKRGAYKLGGSDADSWGTVGDEEEIGNEIDVVANIMLAEKLQWQLGMGLFSPGKYLNEQAGQEGEKNRFLYSQFLATF